jgi:hypothetical protein
LSGLSSLRKNELIDSLTQSVPNHFESQLKLLDEELFAWVSLLAEKKVAAVTGDELSYEQLRSLVGMGIIFPGKINGQKVLIMPEELSELFPLLNHTAILESVSRNSG